MVIGVVQEQHPDRARLYAQWRQYDWPIFVDSLNLLDVAVVPVPIALDASGVVRHRRISPSTVVKEFIEARFPVVELPGSYNRAPVPNVAPLRARAEKQQSAQAWRELGDACFLLSRSSEHRETTAAPPLCDAVVAYQRAVELDSSDGRAQFRLGVALRERSESKLRRPGDAQEAVRRWGEALAINPNQYIWRRRIQQYGPRLDKPYNFYFWIEQARKEIAARGETPVVLSVEPRGSELAPPAGKDEAPGSGATQSPRYSKICGADTSRLQRDVGQMVAIEPTITPARVRPGHLVRARVLFRVNEQSRPYWNNEADDLTVCLDLPQGVELGEGTLSHPNQKQPETQETRSVEFEFAVEKTAPRGPIEVPAYALYYVCGNKGGKCRYQRQDFTLTLQVDPEAPTIR